MPVAVSSTKVCDTYVTDIRYREDAAGWNKPEDLPFSNIRSFREQELGNQRETHRLPVFPFCPLAAVFEVEQVTTVFMKKQYQAVTAEEAVKVIKSGDHVHISSVSNVPQCLVKALCDRDHIFITSGILSDNWQGISRHETRGGVGHVTRSLDSRVNL